MDVARGQLQGDDLMAVVEDEVQLEAEEPAHRGLAALGQIGKHLVPANAMIVAHRQGGGIDVVEPGPGPQVTVQEEQQRLGEAVVEALEMFEARTVSSSVMISLGDMRPAWRRPAGAQQRRLPLWH